MHEMYTMQDLNMLTSLIALGVSMVAIIAVFVNCKKGN